MAEGVEALARDKTRKPGKVPLPPVRCRASSSLCSHWIGRMLAKAAGVSSRSVQRILEAHNSLRIASGC
jgi:hypothetical protein